IERENWVPGGRAAHAPQLLEARLVGRRGLHETMERRGGRGRRGGAAALRQGEGLPEEPGGFTRQLGELPLERLEVRGRRVGHAAGEQHVQDRKSTRLNSSHLGISYAVFCLKKKNRELDHLDVAL